MTTQHPPTPLAVIGMACLLPGARSPEEFWAALVAGTDLRTEPGAEVFGTSPDVPGGWGDPEHRITATRGGFVTGWTDDMTGLRVPERRLAGLGPIVRWPLHVAREALRDAGIGERDDVLARTGLIVGNYSFPTEQSSAVCVPLVREAVSAGLRDAGLPIPPTPPVPADDPAAIRPAGRPAAVVGAALGLGGPTLVLDAACSSALYGVALAAEYLTAGTADVVLAGAVCAADPLLIHLSFSDLHAYPADGMSQPFHPRSSGIVTGQGAGMLVLKRLPDAIRDGDRIHAVVESIGLSNDGAGAHLLSPNVRGQLAAYRAAYPAGPGHNPVDYIECHATGTPLGDPTEMRGVAEFFGDRVPLLGSVKGNTGHLLTVAGFSSMLKTILAMRHGTIPATPGLAELRVEEIGLPAADRIVRRAMPWPDHGDGRPRRAGVSAFGFGGTDAHLVLAQPPGPTHAPTDSPAYSPIVAAGGSPRPDGHQPDEEKRYDRPDPAARPPRLAVRGLGVRAGRCTGVDALARVLHAGVPDLVQRPEKRWYGAETLDSTAGVADLPGGYADQVAVDVRGYRIPPADLRDANPQHLLLFEAADEALAAAGLEPPAAGGRPERRIAVLVAMEMEPRAHVHRARFDIGVHLRAELDRTDVRLPDGDLATLEAAVRDAVHLPIGANEVLSYIGNVMASRISSSRNFTGPAFTVSGDHTVTARAIELAGLLLRDPTIEGVLVAAVELAAGAENTLARAALAAKAGDEPPALADAAVAVLLTRAGETPAPGTVTIDAVSVRGCPPDSDPTGPAAVARAAVGDALSTAGFDAADVDQLVLAGPPDPARLAQVAAAYRGGTPCAVSGPTPLLGDGQRVDVLLGLAAAVVTLSRGELAVAPRALHPAARATPGFAESDLRLLDEPLPWLRRSRTGRRVCAVHAADEAPVAHLVLSLEPGPVPTTDPTRWADGDGALLLPLRGADGVALAADARSCLAQLAAGRDATALIRDRLAAGSGTLTAALVAADVSGLQHELQLAARDLPAAVAAGRDWCTPTGSYCTPRPLGPGPVAFVYPGAFTTYPGAGREVFGLFPRLRQDFEAGVDRPRDRFRLDAVHPSAPFGLDRADRMRHEQQLLGDVPTMLSAGTTFAVLQTSLLRDVLGIEPAAGLGYSLGESSMMFALGGWAATGRDDERLSSSPLLIDQLAGPRQVVRRRWQLDDSVPDGSVWASFVVLAGADQVRGHLAGLDRVFITHINTPNEVVIAGDPAQCRELIDRSGCRAARSPANQVMHCPVVDSELAGLAALNDFPLGSPAGTVELLSGYDLRPAELRSRAEVATRVAQTLCRPVDFVALVQAAHRRGHRYFVEVGPGSTCTRWIGETLADRAHVAVSVDRRGVRSAVALAQALARLVSHGLPVRLDALFGEVAPASTPAGFRHTVTCGGPSIRQRVHDAAAPVLAAARQAVPAGVGRSPARLDPSPTPAGPLRAPAGPLRAPAGPGPIPIVPPDRPRPRPPVNRTAIHVSEVAMPTVPHPSPGVSPHPSPEPSPYPSPVAGPTSAVAVLDAEPFVFLPRTPPAETGPVESRPVEPAGTRRVRFDEAQVLEFARGRISAVFGEAFAPIDDYSVRVRLPEPPYLFVSRVTELDAVTGELRPSRITTEYDVPAGAWYTLDGLVPCAVAIEAGQADLMLISYLGVDFANKGERAYRLLDSTLVFHGRLPREGQTLRYEIGIDRFVRNGDCLLFFFHYRCFADDELILELQDACAGFFSAAELAGSAGVVPTKADRERRAALRPAAFAPLARTDRTSLTGRDLELLAEGRPAQVFGPEWDQTADGCNPSVRLPGPALRMIDEVTCIDRTGGPRRLGQLQAVKRLDPDGWYFRCHFPGDPVLAGSIVAEGGVQLLQAFSMYLGLHLVLPDAEFQPVPGLQTSVKVRGQITPDVTEIRYTAEIIDITLVPRPTVVADITVWHGDKPIIRMQNFGVQLREKPGTPFRPGAGGIPPFLGRRNRNGEAAFINELHLAHAAKGDLAVAMGPEFEVYADRRAPYIPNGDFRFVDRIMALDGVRGDLRAGSTMVTEYDCPDDAWYFTETGGGMPNCVRMESSLQAAILLGYYLGATLGTPEDELSIRNLDGSATLLRDIDLRGKTIRHSSEMLSSQAVPGSVLQRFRYRLSADGEEFYVGESLFGYFTEQALAHQAGLDNGRFVPPWLDSAGAAGTVEVRHLDRAAFDGAALDEAPGTDGADRGPALPAGHLRLTDEADLVRDGGRFGLGYLKGTRAVSPQDWYFACHFHRDPVMPGSLGVEAVIEGLQMFCRETDLARGLGPCRFTSPTGVRLGWKYRGQILPDDGEMTYELHIKEIRRTPGQVLVVADASVWKPGLRIYELTDIAVGIQRTTDREDQ